MYVRMNEFLKFYMKDCRVCFIIILNFKSFEVSNYFDNNSDFREKF